MLCTYLTGRRWRWLASHPTPERDELLLVEREGACPGDPDGEIITVTGVAPGDLAEAARRWLGNRLEHPRSDSPAALDCPPARARAAIAWDPGDRRVDPPWSRAAVAAAGGAASDFCVFGNPAAHRR